MIRRIPIRVKVAGALLLPLGALVVGAAVIAADIGRQATEMAHQTELTTASIGHAGLISALQSERNLASLEMVGLEGATGGDIGASAGARRDTDAAVARMVRQISQADGELRADYASALDGIEALPALRADADLGRAAPGMRNRDEAHDVFSRYSEMISAVFASYERFAVMVDAPELRHGGELVLHGAQAADSVAQLVERLVFLATGPDSFEAPTDIAAIAELRRDVRRDGELLEAHGTGRYDVATQALLVDDRLAQLDELVDALLRGRTDIDSAAVLETVPLGPHRAYAEYRDEVAEILEEVASERAAAATAQRRRYVGAALAVVAGALAIAYVASRSITRPLRELSRQARVVASEHLPEAVASVRDAPIGDDIVVPPPAAIVVHSTDEVGDVAVALNELQVAAIDLAVEQAALQRTVADSFISLGHRNQNLLQRLLSTIGELEDAAEDPVTLERLYQLDHLATRMHRNAGSLLVLAQASSAPSPRRPMAVVDIARAALGQVEGCERVGWRTIAPASVIGGAAGDLAHILAELVENALRNSPPTELVEVGGTSHGTSYTLGVIDHGLGMTNDELAAANDRLQGSTTVVFQPSKQLGLVVTAALARRHGIAVDLSATGAAGVTASIHIPASLLTDAPPRPDALGLTPATARMVVDHLVDAPAPHRFEPLFAGTLGRHDAPEGT